MISTAEDAGGRVSIEQSRFAAPTARIEQAGAICLCTSNGEEWSHVLLIGSLRNGRWGIPKGHIEAGETSREAAQREAFEEAGIKGVTLERAVGTYSYRKEGTSAEYCVAVHLLAVTQIADDYPEKGLRRSRWVPIDIASREVAQVGLRRVLHHLIKTSVTSILPAVVSSGLVR